eukprot:TRINITY_DN14572_c0_g1_i1.p1 TRINITY_DN14572_c0_g1~~TRINITY_DN14572_c0_g1_i1.p1  ORF type:complete len:311 (+),score=73.89 TRINITY_DN14572_c0_g1_i1:79-933(+)
MAGPQRGYTVFITAVGVGPMPALNGRLLKTFVTFHDPPTRAELEQAAAQQLTAEYSKVEPLTPLLQVLLPFRIEDYAGRLHELWSANQLREDCTVHCSVAAAAHAQRDPGLQQQEVSRVAQALDELRMTVNIQREEHAQIIRRLNNERHLREDDVIKLHLLIANLNRRLERIETTAPANSSLPELDQAGGSGMGDSRGEGFFDDGNKSPQHLVNATEPGGEHGLPAGVESMDGGPAAGLGGKGGGKGAFDHCNLSSHPVMVKRGGRGRGRGRGGSQLRYGDTVR